MSSALDNLSLTLAGLSCAGAIATALTANPTYALLPTSATTLSLVAVQQRQRQQQQRLGQQVQQQSAQIAARHQEWQQVARLQQQVAHQEYQVSSLVQQQGQMAQGFHTELAFPLRQIAVLQQQLEQQQQQLEVLRERQAEVPQWVSALHEVLSRQQSPEPSAATLKLVLDRAESRRYLLKALDKAKRQVILVCPWIAYGLDSQVLSKLECFLHKSGTRLCIGFGYDEIQQVATLQALLQQSQMKARNGGFDGYAGLTKLLRLAAAFPGQVELKAIGTHEKYIVCDERFCTVGSHNFLSSGPQGSTQEAGIYTNDPQIIHELIQRYSSSPSRLDLSQLPEETACSPAQNLIRFPVVRPARR